MGLTNSQRNSIVMEHGENGPATLAKISEMMFNLINQSQDRLQMQFEEERSKHVLLIEEQRKQLDTHELVIKEMEVDRTKLFRANVLQRSKLESFHHCLVVAKEGVLMVRK